MKFKTLSSYLEQLEKTTSRIEITKILALVLSKSSAEEEDKIVYLLLGQLAPQYRGIVFNLAEKLMFQVLSQAYQREVDEVKKLFKKTGDLGLTAETLSKMRRKENLDLSVGEVYQRLLEIALDEGEGSQERKIEKMANLLRNVDPLSARFLSRIPLGRLRLGFSDKTILDALSWMEVGGKDKKTMLERAYQVVPDIGLLAKKVKEMGIEKAVSGIKPIVGVPVLPMLAQRLKSPSEMIEKMGKVFVEPKFDGLRVQIHYQKQGRSEKIKAFTRNLNDVAGMFPELNNIGRHLNAREVILDTEAVGMDPEMKRLADFQTTMQRRRKYEIEKKAKEIPLSFQVFDIIYMDGKNLMDTPYYRRREILKNTIKESSSLLVVDEAVLTDEAEVINTEYKKRISQGLEGVIVKKYNTSYLPGRTGWRWVKMKEEEEAVGKLADTFDCVVMGYYAGRGKRAKFGMGGFLVGVLDRGLIKTITKIGTGLTDEQFSEMHKRLKQLEVKQKPKEYGKIDKTLTPDSWVYPSLIVEIAADEITKSPIHSAGFALRFPRLVRFRDDKSVEQATTVSEIKRLFKLQKKH